MSVPVQIYDIPIRIGFGVSWELGIVVPDSETGSVERKKNEI
jgi:hypothetical protein